MWLACACSQAEPPPAPEGAAVPAVGATPPATKAPPPPSAAPAEPAAEPPAAEPSGAEKPPVDLLPPKASAPAAALRAWARAQEPGAARTPARALAAEVLADLAPLVAGMNPAAKPRWVKVIGEGRGDAGPLLAVAATYGREVDEEMDRKSDAIGLSVIDDRDGAYHLRQSTHARKEPGDRWPFLKDRDLDGDGVLDTLLAYESSSHGESYRGLVAMTSARPAASRIPTTEWIGQSHESALRGACWTRIDDRPALIAVRSVTSEDPDADQGAILRWEAEVFAMGDDGVFASTDVYAALEHPAKGKLKNDLAVGDGPVAEPGGCFDTANVVVDGGAVQRVGGGAMRGRVRLTALSLREDDAAGKRAKIAMRKHL